MRGSILILGLVTLLAGCQAGQAIAPLPHWEYQHVRLLDPLDAAQPGQEIIAAYFQHAGNELDVRVDWLDQGLTPEADLYLALDYTAGGQTGLPLETQADLAWDSLVCIPAHGSLQVLDAGFQPQPGMALRVLRDAEQDALSIRLRLAPQAQRRLAIQVFSTAPGSRVAADQTAVFHSQAAPPPPAAVLFAFWDVYPAYSPATALRRWNGAHTGPLGGSHGLGLLLRSAEQAHIPLALLDLKTPAALSALDALGELPRLQRMAQAGLLILPEPLLFDRSAPAAARFGLASPFGHADSLFGHADSRFAFGPGSNLPAPQPGYALVRWNGAVAPAQGRRSTAPPANPAWLTIPVGVQLPNAITQEGITLEMRRAVVAAATASASSRTGQAAPLLLGGSLPESTWGNPALARMGFRYINHHPWIQVLDAQGLAGWVRSGARLSAEPVTPVDTHVPGTASSFSPGEHENPAGQNRLPVRDDRYRPRLPAEEAQALQQALAGAPANPLRLAAWQAYAALSAPVYPAAPQLPALRATQTGHVWALLSASRWAEAPFTRQACYADQHFGTQGICILATETVYLQFGASSGAIQYAFVRQPGQPDTRVHQWIGPSSQLITGLGDPATWQTDDGRITDPQVIPGAFFEPGRQYWPSLPAAATADGQPLALVFDSPELQKRYTWNNTTLQVSYTFKTTAAVTPNSRVRIPLLLDPWERFSPGWVQRYTFHSDGSQQVTGQLENGLSVHIRGQGLRLSSFLDSLPALSRAEDPNQDYPAGHYLPFPLALVEAPLQGDLELWIELAGKLP